MRCHAGPEGSKVRNSRARSGSPGACTMPEMPRIVPPIQESIVEAASHLRAGGVVAFATETVYGLGADTFNLNAIDRVYALKGRPFDNPLIAHVLDVAMAREILAESWDDRCSALATRFWPGPLTMIVPKRREVPDRATAGRATIAIRCPDHPAALQLLRALGSPISAPSANRSGQVSPTTAQHVADEFAEVEDLLILDGGPCVVGIESTVLDMTREPPEILRPGSITLDDIARVIGEARLREWHVQDASPGTSPRHYAPRAPLRLLNGHDLRNEIVTLRGRSCAVLAFPPLSRALRRRNELTLFTMPDDPVQYAARLYATLREADGAGVHAILIEAPPKDDERWTAVLDRLRRASARS